MIDSVFLSRRSIIALALLSASGCGSKSQWKLVDVKDMYPELKLQMTDVRSGRLTSATDYAGKTVILFFGYSFCPEICPTTLLTLTSVMEHRRELQEKTVVLFVSVDPGRDTPEALNRYVESFAPNVTALVGTSNELASLARRYRVAYTVNPGSGSDDYTVDHTATVFIFDKTGRLRLLAPYGTGADDFEHDLLLLA